MKRLRSPNPVEPTSARDLPLQSAKVELSPERTPSPDVSTEPAAVVGGEQDEEVCSPVSESFRDGSERRLRIGASGPGSARREAGPSRQLLPAPRGPPSGFCQRRRDRCTAVVHRAGSGTSAVRACQAPDPESKRSQYREAFGVKVKRTSSGKWKNPRQTQP